jgi:hypothetical protein
MKSINSLVLDGFGIWALPVSVVLISYAKHLKQGLLRIILIIALMFFTEYSCGRAITFYRGYGTGEEFNTILLITSSYNTLFGLAMFLWLTMSLVIDIYHDLKIWLSSAKKIKTTLADIKMIFDGGKQIGMGLAIALSLPLIQAPMKEELEWEDGTIGSVNCLYVLVTVYLIILGYIWIGFSFKSKPSSKTLHGASLLTFGVITATILYYIIKTHYKDINFNPWN